MKETIKIKVDQTKLPNKLHFEIQKQMRANVFKNKKTYNRKLKHKNRNTY